MHISIVCGDFVAEYSNNERELAHGLTELGHRVTVFTSNRKPLRFFGRGAKTAIEEETIFGITVVRCKAAFTLKGFPYMSKLTETIRRSDTDLIQATECFLPHSWHAFSAASKKGVPFTFVQHLYFKPDGWFNLLFGILDKTRCAKIARESDKIFAVSTAAKKFLCERQKIPQDEVVFTPTGVDTDRFKPRRVDHGDPTILAVARLVKAKGLKYLVRALRMVKDSFPDARLIIVGKGEEENNLRRLVCDLGLKDSVVFRTEYVANEEMAGVYGACDVFVLPSLREPAGIAAIEALSCGLPLIVTDVGGLSDVVVDGANGFLVPPCDPKSIADKLLLLLEDEDLRNRFGSASRRRALQMFNYKEIARSVSKAYEEIAQ